MLHCLFAQQAVSQPVMQQQFTSAASQPTMSAPSYETSMSSQPVMDSIMSATHDNGLFPQTATHEVGWLVSCS